MKLSKQIERDVLAAHKAAKAGNSGNSYYYKQLSYRALAEVDRLNERVQELESKLDAVKALRYLAEARRDYCNVDPQDSGEIAKLACEDPQQFTLWVEAETAEQLARILEHPDKAWGWLPSWRQGGWDELRKKDQS